MYIRMSVLQPQPLPMESYVLVVTPLIQELFLFTVCIFSETVMSQHPPEAIIRVDCGNHS
jgi:hypothetical protein